MKRMKFPICFFCKHCIEFNKKTKKYVCKAYLKSIPDKILYGEVNHKKPYKGDNGIQFELKS